MNKEQAFNILEQALNVANTKGAFILADAVVIQNSLNLIRKELGIKVDEGKDESKPEAPQVTSKDKTSK